MANAPDLNLNLSVEEVNLILNTLAELPAKVSMGLINKISIQLKKQLQVAQQGPGMADNSRAVTNALRDDEVLN